MAGEDAREVYHGLAKLVRGCCSGLGAHCEAVEVRQHPRHETWADRHEAGQEGCGWGPTLGDEAGGLQ